MQINHHSGLPLTDAGNLGGKGCIGSDYTNRAQVHLMGDNNGTSGSMEPGATVVVREK